MTTQKHFKPTFSFRHLTLIYGMTPRNEMLHFRELKNTRKRAFQI